MSKKVTVKTSPPNKHVVDAGGHCRLCMRTGAELKGPCPGYKTAAEYVDWTKQKPVPKKGKNR